MPDVASPSIAVEDVRLAFGRGRASIAVLNGVTASFHRGDFTLLTGPSGSGKTSLLSILGCILPPDSGDVRLLGGAIAGLSEDRRTQFRLRRVGFVFQAFRLFDALSARENVALTLELLGMGRRDRLQRAEEALIRLGLESRMSLKPRALSGGEKQRVALARAIVHDPPIILADEPTASLDSENGLKVAALLRDIAETQRRTVVVVSHDERLRAYAHRCLQMLDGRILEEREC